LCLQKSKYYSEFLDVQGGEGRAFLLSTIQKRSMFLYVDFKGLQNISEWTFFSPLFSGVTHETHVDAIL
jgi:hypothetical protein